MEDYGDSPAGDLMNRQKCCRSPCRFPGLLSAGAPAHCCNYCKKGLHAICGVPVPSSLRLDLALESPEEGHGAYRICESCFASNSGDDLRREESDVEKLDWPRGGPSSSAGPSRGEKYGAGRPKKRVASCASDELRRRAF